jgi:glycosyltransferase involved in cell wall biosynthesis
MACGVPVAASRTGSLPEVLGEAGEFFDPYNPQDIHRVIQKVLSHSDLAQNMRDQGLRRAKDFSWDIAARETLSVFQRTVNA